MDWVAKNIERVQAAMRVACQQASRDPRSITVVAVTKGVPAEFARAAWHAGLRHFGENRVQEAQPKIAALADVADVTWHLIGHLQTNKAHIAAHLFHVIHAVDSLRVAEALDARAAQRTPPLDVLLQVNVAGEATKFGVSLESADALARQLHASSHLRWRGLMTIAPALDDPEGARPVFRALRQLRDRPQHALGVERLQLSMGMSHDFTVAIEEGADLVRIGSAIFKENFWHDR